MDGIEKKEDLQKAKVIETYNITTDNIALEVNIIDDEKAFVRRYFLNFPTYGPGTMALLTNLKGNILSDSSTGASREAGSKFVAQARKRFRERAENLLAGEHGISEEAKNQLIAILLNEMLGLGKIEFLLTDPNLEEIVVNSSKTPVWVYHKKYGWLLTNIKMKDEDETENYSSIIARRIGKQITILDPLLDAHLVTGDRANATLFPISSAGNTITIRKFRRDPWTVTDFINCKTANKEIMALIWMMMEYEMNMIVSGGTGSGKTSFLNVCLPFIQPNHRILTIEDSVAGESEIVYSYKGKVRKAAIGELVDGIIEDDSIKDASVENDFGIKVMSMSPEGKIEWSEPSSFIRHSVEKNMLDIILESGRSISVTEDHSLFALSEEGKIEAVSGKELGKGSFIAVPRLANWLGQKVKFDLRNSLECFDNCFVKSLEVTPLVEKHFENLGESYSENMLNGVMRKSLASVQLMRQIPESVSTGFICSRLGTQIPLELEIDETMACFAGLWLADGCYDKNSVLISVVEEECREIVRKVAMRFNANAKMHSDGVTLMVNSKPFRLLLEKPLGFSGNSYSKHLPDWAFDLEKGEASALIRGYFSGDGRVRKHDIAIRSCSKQLLKDMQVMLLRFGIPLRVKWKKLPDKTFEARIGGRKFVEIFQGEIGFLQKEKMAKVEKILATENHDVSDIVPVPRKFYKMIKEELREEIGKSMTYNTWKNFLTRQKKSCMGRETLKSYVRKFEKLQETELANLASNDLQWDRVQSVQKRKFSGFVYDLSVPENESFVCENIVAHNTRELMLPPFLHWVPLTTRDPNSEGKGGVCLYPGTWFVTGNGEINEISEYVEKRLATRPTQKIESNVLAAPGEDDTVLAGDPERLAYQSEKTGFVSRVTKREFVCKVECENGETMTLTENTKLPVVGKNGRVELLTPLEIKQGNYYLPVFARLDIEGTVQEINALDLFAEGEFYAVGGFGLLQNLIEEQKEKGLALKEIAKKCGIKRQAFNWYKKTGIAKISILKKLSEDSSIISPEQLEKEISIIKARGGGAKEVRIPKHVDEDLAYLAGFVLAEKTLAANGIHIVQKDELPEIERLVKKIFDISVIHKKKKYNQYRILSQIVMKIMKETFGAAKSKQIRVPKCIMRSHNEVIAAFLAGCIDGDGTVGRNRVSLATGNKEAAIEFKYLLTRLGIWSRVQKAKRAWVINVCTREDVAEACKKLGFRLEKNKRKAEKVKKIIYGFSTKRNRVPAMLLHSYLKGLMQNLTTGEKKKHLYHATCNQTSVPKNYLQKMLMQTGFNAKEIEKMQLFLREDLEFVKIRKVQIAKNKKNIPSYDITPEKSTYFIAGINNLTLVMDTMLDLLVNSLRMRPDRIIVGEIRRQKEAEVMFEAMHTGHSVYTTFHANTSEETIRRFVNPPVNIPPTMLESVHLNIVMFRNRRLGVRRILQVAEFLPERRGGKDEVKANVLYRWRGSDDQIVPHGESIRLFDELSMHTGFSRGEIDEELARKQSVIAWMLKFDLHDVTDVGRVMASYYRDPEEIMSMIKKGGVPKKGIGIEEKPNEKQ